MKQDGRLTEQVYRACTPIYSVPPGLYAEYLAKANSYLEKVLAPSAAIIGNRIVVTGGGLGNPLPLTATTHVATLPGR